MEYMFIYQQKTKCIYIHTHTHTSTHILWVKPDYDEVRKESPCVLHCPQCCQELKGKTSPGPLYIYIYFFFNTKKKVGKAGTEEQK